MSDTIQASIALSTIIRQLATEAHLDNRCALAQRYHELLDAADDTMLASIITRVKETLTN